MGVGCNPPCIRESRVLNPEPGLARLRGRAGAPVELCSGGCMRRVSESFLLGASGTLPHLLKRLAAFDIDRSRPRSPEIVVKLTLTNFDLNPWCEPTGVASELRVTEDDTLEFATTRSRWFAAIGRQGMHPRREIVRTRPLSSQEEAIR